MTLRTENLEIFSLSVLCPALFLLTSVCTLDSPGFWLVTWPQSWPLIGQSSNRIQCSDAFQLLSRMSRSRASVFRPIIAHPQELLLAFISLLLCTCHSIDQHNLLLTDNVIVNYILVSQFRFAGKRKLPTQKGTSLNIRPQSWSSSVNSCSLYVVAFGPW